MKEITLGDLYLKRGTSVNPANFQNEVFEYYSIPAYDSGNPDICKGSNIGSSKKLFQPNDILLSRIVPHIRRCWIVGGIGDYRQIGSSEWIVFRSDEILSSYLRHYLMSNEFNAKFLKTIKGVGGSLMRADPKQVARFKFKIPPLAKQQDIAKILDNANVYRQKTKSVLNKYKLLSQSLFLEMFGEKGKFKQETIENLVTKITDGTHHTPKYTECGVPFLRVTDITKSNNTKKFISEEEHLQLIKRCRPEKGDILYTKNGTIGVAKLIDWDYDFSIFVSLCLIKPKHDIINNKFLESFLNTPFALKQAMRHSKTGTITNLHLVEIRKIKIPLPEMHIQMNFVKKVEAIEAQMELAQQQLNHAEDLFNSLLQKAFKGDLVQ